MRRFAPQLFAQLFCISVMFMFASTSQGQHPAKSSVAQQVIQNREWALRDLRRNLISTAEREKLLARLALQEDFRKLQIVNNELMKRTFSYPPNQTQAITQEEIRSSLGKIEKLAKRLRYSLAIPKVEPPNSGKSATPAKDVQLSSGLLLLDRAVMDFVENPLFQQTRVFDAELAVRAGKDLDQILRLTDFLRKLTREK